MELEINKFYAGEIPITPAIVYHGLVDHFDLDRHELPEISILLPRLSVGSHNEFSNLLAVIDVDLYDALGIRRAPALSLPLKVDI
jgi:hypothetical protein